MQLLSLLTDSYIARSPIRFQYTESEGVDLDVFISIHQHQNLVDTVISFKNVAQFQCINVYFPEFYYQKYCIINQIESGFFEVLDGNFFTQRLLEEKSKIYLLYGYDCYLVVECCDYQIS